MLNTICGVIKPNWLKERILRQVSNRSLPWVLGMCGASGACQSTGQGWVLPRLLSGAKHQQSVWALCSAALVSYGLLEARPHPPLRPVMHSSWRSPAFSACWYCSKIDMFQRGKALGCSHTYCFGFRRTKDEEVSMLKLSSVLCLHLSLASFSWIPFCQNDAML